MFKRVSRGFGHTAKQAQKFHLSLFVEKLDNLPASIKRCRVVWSRGPKVQMTDIKDISKGAVVFKQQLSQIATMYKDAKGGYEPKEYRFQVQVPDKADTAKFMTVGKADLDLSFFVLAQGQAQSKLIPIVFKVGPASTGYLKVTITPELAGDVDDDGLTEVSGMTGVNPLSEEQDLSGFHEEADEAEGRPSPAAGGSGKKPSRFAAVASPSAKPAVPTEQPTAPQPQETKQSKELNYELRRIAADDSRKALAAAAAAVHGTEEEDGDISPVSLSPCESSELPPQESTKGGSREAGKVSVVGPKGGRVAAAGAASAAAKDARSQLLSTGHASSSADGSKGAASGRGMVRASSNKSIPDLTEDEARSELFSSGGKTSTKASERSRATPAAVGSSPANNCSSTTTSGTAAAKNRAPSVSQAAATASTKQSAGKSGAALSRSTSSTSSDAGASVASAATASTMSGIVTGGAAVRRGLLDRARPKEVSGQLGAASVSAATSEAPGSSKGAPAASSRDPSRARKHSLSDDDGDDDTAAEELGYTTAVQPLKPPVGASRQSSTSQIPQPSGLAPHHWQQRRPSTANVDSAAYKQLAAENEKLRAQMLALRDQAAQAEDARRRAGLAAENAAAERNDYKAQVQELEHQLKEAIIGMLSSDEAKELQQEIKQLEQLVEQQKKQLQQQEFTKVQRLDVSPEQEAWDQQRCQPEQQVTEAEHRVGQLQEQLQAQQEREEQLQLDVQEQSNLAADLQQQLQTQLQALKLQQEQLHSQLHATAELEQQLADMQEQCKQFELISIKLEHQRNAMLELFLTQAEEAVQVATVQQHVTDQQVVAEIQDRLATVDQDSIQTEVQHILVVFKAAVIAATCRATSSTDTASTDSAEIYELQDAKLADEQQQRQQPGTFDVGQHMAKLQAEVIQLRQEKQQWSHEQQQQQQQQDRSSDDLRKLSWQVDDVEHHGPLIRAGMQHHNLSSGDGSQEELLQAKQELACSVRKVQHLKQARDKLELILRDFEKAALEEKEHLLMQLSAANNAARQVTQRLAESQQQLDDSQQQFASISQQLAETQQQLQEAEQQLGRSQRQHQSQQRVEAAKAGIATASSTLQMIAFADSAGPPGVQEALAAAQQQIADLQRQLTEAEASRRSLDTELVRLKRQLADEQSERDVLEEQLAQKLEDTEDYLAQDTVAAFEAKYNRLKTRYRELTESHREEVDQLQEEIAKLKEHMVDLEAAAVQLEAARSQAQHGEATLADTLAKSSKATSELATLRAEHQTIMQELVSAKLDLAQCREREVVGKRELYKAKETNMKLASKMTKLETLVYKK